MNTSKQQNVLTSAAANTPLQRELNALMVQAGSHLPEDLLRQVQSPIEELITSGAAQRALKVGDPAPDFTLPEASGHWVRLSHLLQRGPVVIAFYRGAWCPYCNLQLHAYQQTLPQFQALGASLLAISPQTPDQSLQLSEKQSLTYPVLSDVGNHVARRFGLVFQIAQAVRAAYQQVGADLPAYNGDASWELPMPGTFLLDAAGIVRLAFIDPNFIHRLDPSLIIEQLKHELSLREK